MEAVYGEPDGITVPEGLRPVREAGRHRDVRETGGVRSR